jgi:Tfp pilus assembly protein PilF
MSVINRVLRDLEQRRGSDAATAGLPAGVLTSANHDQPAAHQRRWLVYVLAVALAGVLGYVIQTTDFSGPQLPPAPKPRTAQLERPAAPASPAAAAVTPDKAAPVPLPTPTPSTAPKAQATKAPATIPPTPAKPIAPASSETASAPPAASAPVRAAAPTLPGLRNGEAVKTISPHQRANALYGQALQSLSNGRSTPARGSLEEALQADPSHHEARQLLAALLAEQQQPDAAESVLAAGLAYNPPAPLVLALARLRVARSGDEAGIRLLLEHQNGAKESADYQAFFGTLLLHRQQWAESGRRFANALNLNPAPAAWWAGYGLALFGSQQYGEARDALLRARQQGPLPPALLDAVNERLGDLKRLTNDPTTAKE